MLLMEEQLNRIFSDSLNNLIANDTANIENNVNERTLCGRLAYYLESNLKNIDIKGYYTDIEYNRNNGKIKTILNSEMKIIPINCDIIVHSRANNKKQDNLIAIEMKKASRSSAEKEGDRDRLIALTKDSYDGIWVNDGTALPEQVCGYILGYYIEIDRVNKRIQIETYKKGEKVSTETIVLQ